jgi:uncharacterized protein
MKSSETDILALPSLGPLSPEHWLARLEHRLSSARLVPVAEHADLPVAIRQVRAAVLAAHRPVVFVAHGVGAVLVAHVMAELQQQAQPHGVRGAFLVAAPSAAWLATQSSIHRGYADVPRAPLPFPSLLVASSDDAQASLEDAADMAMAWGSQLVEAGPAGSIDAASGHGPWPEGIMRFAGFLSRLKA